MQVWKVKTATKKSCDTDHLIFLNSVSVEEGTSVRITEYDLQVVHAQMEPEDIKYTVTSGQPNNFLPFLKKKNGLPSSEWMQSSILGHIIKPFSLFLNRLKRNQLLENCLKICTNILNKINK